MEFLGIGPLELAFIILLIIIVFGPKDIVNASKTIGKSLNQFIRSDTWKTINQTSRELKNLPTRLMREAGLDDLEKIAKEEMTKVDSAIQESVRSSISADIPDAINQEPDDPSDSAISIDLPKIDHPE
jgi:Sec-independent protein translocase protein TatA